MPTLHKTFDTIKQANRYQFNLYQKWDSVQLLSAPLFSEQGRYVWAVNGKIENSQP